MARSKSSPRPDPQPPSVPPTQAIELLEEQITKADQLLSSRPISSDAYSTWELLTRNYLTKAFGLYSPNVSAVMDVGKYGSFPFNAGEHWWENHRTQSLITQKKKLEGLRELLQTELRISGSSSAPAEKVITGHKIFLVHGHDERALHESARFLEKLQQQVIVLREQPNQGRTIIEKFEDYADVGFAVVLLTGDDKGSVKSAETSALRPRARQNVVFELGYFIGRLGRNRVCALYSEDVELPSDYSGVLYTRFDATGAWRLDLAKELKAAGFPVDMNLAI